MTVAGLSTIAITTRMLQDDSDVGADGRPDCCSTPPPNLAMENGRKWMAENFSVTTNPGFDNWYYYYLYGLERAGRMSGVRFFGNYDWYRRAHRCWSRHNCQLANGCHRVSQRTRSCSQYVNGSVIPVERICHASSCINLTTTHPMAKHWNRANGIAIRRMS